LSDFDGVSVSSYCGLEGEVGVTEGGIDGGWAVEWVESHRHDLFDFAAAHVFLFAFEFVEGVGEECEVWG